MDDEAVTLDNFLDGKLRIYQPKVGYRAATDPVLLAAAIPAKSGQTVLELGCGVGTAIMCLSHRVPGLVLHGVELQKAYKNLAIRNVQENNLSIDITCADIMDLPSNLREMSFDQVMANPPFYDSGAHTNPQDGGKVTAHMERLTCLNDWIDVGLRRLKPRGYFTIIHRVERLADILASLKERAGDIRVLPIAAREGRASGRVIVRARKASAGPLKLLPPLIMHSGSHHENDGDSFTSLANDILREAAPISLD